MRAPVKSRLDDIVAEIVGALYGESAEYIAELCGRVIGDHNADLMSAEIDVRWTIRLLQALDTPVSYRGETKSIPFRGWRQDNLSDVRALLNQIKRLRKAVAATNASALFALFGGEPDVHTGDQIPPDEVQQKMLQRLGSFTSTLSWLQQRCEFLLTERPGVPAKVKYRQHRVAHEAWRMLHRFGHKPADGSAKSLYGRITSLLWEALTDEADKDLQRACKTTLQLVQEIEPLSP